MKKLFFLTLLCFSFFEFSFAQQAIIKVNPLNPLTPILTRYTVGAEIAITQHSSLSLFITRLNANLKEDFKNKNQEEIEGAIHLTNWAFMPEYRYYFSQQALNGFYGGAYANYARMNADISINGGSASTTGKADVSFNNYGLGLMTGYNFLIKEHFSIDIFTGLGGFWYNVNEITINYQNEDVVQQKIPIPIAGLFPRIGLNLGYAF
ncbi:DUF3575 domain-containing protein [Bernardetia sp. ABR2-2B]|uniref:DUF3575 domain-containing protein n=1 Tax=Bernardetia sp. ABR2-2B TaxID=3127472 RepID=UPI0030D39045